MNQETRNPGNGFAGKQKIIFSCFLAFLISFWASWALAGDAVAIGYNQDGIWTGVTYYCSSKPKGGKNYKTENGAREEAIRDLRRRSSYAASTVKILSSSDSTGFVAVARGHDQDGRDFHAVGRGKTQAEADKKAFELLTKAGAGAEQKIVYRYFSYGSYSK